MHQQRAALAGAVRCARGAVGENDSPVAQRVTGVEAGLERREAEGLEGLDGLHQGRREAQQDIPRRRLWQDFPQPGRRRGQPGAVARGDIDPDPDHRVAPRVAGLAKAGGLDQDAGQLAIGQPQIVGPLELHARVQAFGQADAHGQRQPRPVGRRQGQPQRKGEGIARLAGPAPAQAAAPGRLLLGHQEGGLHLAGAGPAHQFGVGGADFGQDLHREAREERRYGLPDGFTAPKDVSPHACWRCAAPRGGVRTLGRPSGAQFTYSTCAWAPAGCPGSCGRRTSRGIRP